MTAQEIEEKYNKNFGTLKDLEVILRAQEATYDVHVSRLSGLKALADACGQLKRLELESIKFSQYQAEAQNQIAFLKSALSQKEQELAALSVVAADTTIPTAPTPVTETPKVPEIAEMLKKGARKKSE